MTALLAYENLIPLGTVTAFDTPGYEKENAYDWFTYTWWRGVGAVINYDVEFESENLNGDFSEGFGEDDIPDGWTSSSTIDENNYFTAYADDNRIGITSGDTNMWLQQLNTITPGRDYYGMINIESIDGIFRLLLTGDTIDFDTPGIHYFNFNTTSATLSIGCIGGSIGILNSFYIWEEDYSIDYAACAAHNMDTENSYYQVQYYNGDTWIGWENQLVPDNNAPIFQYRESPVLAPIWRFAISSDTPPLIGIFSLGKVKAMSQGIRPEFVLPPIAFDTKVFNSESVTGQFLGRSIERFGYKINIKQNHIDPAWMLENWPEIVEAIQTQPFFWSWNYENFPDHTVYAWLDGDLPRARFTNPVHMEFNFDCRALHLIRWY